MTMRNLDLTDHHPESDVFYVASSDTTEGVINRVGDEKVTGQWDNLSDGDQSYAILTISPTGIN